jgi:dihydrodipicolinate synthase/N-acetylneuraminate lyase
MTRRALDWRGVFPAVTTQFADDLSIDFPATLSIHNAMIDARVSGLVVMGTVGENNTLRPEEKVELLRQSVTGARGRLPIIVGVSELSTTAAMKFAREAQQAGASALMVLPAMAYVPSGPELASHVLAVARAADLPVMLYNNPAAYRVNIGLDVLEELASQPNIVAIKESSADTRRFTNLLNQFGERYALLAGLDDVALEGMVLGARGWVSGLTNVFPDESVELVRRLTAGDLAGALDIYRWFMPLLHLDAGHDLVQCIKLAEQVMGRGSERVRPPRYPLVGGRRAEVIGLLQQALASRPRLAADV